MMLWYLKDYNWFIYPEFKMKGGPQYRCASRQDTAPLCDITGRSKEIRRAEDQHKSVSLFGSSYRCLKVPQSSAWTILTKRKSHRNVEPVYCPKMDRRCVPEMKGCFPVKWVHQAKHNVEMLAVIIHSQTIPVLTRTERPLREEALSLNRQVTVYRHA